MRVLITGGMGVIGAETSRKFVKEGHRPVIFARHRDESLIGDILDKVDVELGDILGYRAIEQFDVLGQVTNVLAQFLGPPLIERATVNSDGSSLWQPSTDERAGQRRLSRSRRPDNA